MQSPKNGCHNSLWSGILATDARHECASLLIAQSIATVKYH